MSPDRPLRVGYVVKRYPRFSETFIVNEILAHERAGVPIDIFAVRRVNEPHFQSILGEVRSEVIYIPDGMPKAESLWQALAQARSRLPGFWAVLGTLEMVSIEDVYQATLLALQAHGRGIMHFHAHFATVATTVARLAARFAGIGYSFTAHAKDIFHADVEPESFRQKLEDADAVVTVSDFNVDWLRRRYGTAATGVRRIYNGLELDAFPCGSPAERPHDIVAVGRLIEKKGFEILIEACARLRERQVPFRCTIIGHGLLREALAAQVAGLELGDHVVLAGPLPRPEVAARLRAAAVCAAPCVVAEDGDRDGLPTVLIEAMALGTPCVATDVTGIPELVRDDETGLCVPQRDPTVLADALARLLDDTALRVRLAGNARALIEQQFDVDRNASALRSLFITSVEGRDDPLRATG